MTVLDDSGTPIPSASLRATFSGIVLSPLGPGRFSLRGAIPTSGMNLVAEAEGFLPGTLVINAVSDIPSEIRLKSGGSISGRVLDAAGHGVPAARVSASSSFATTAADGRFLLAGLPLGDHSIDVLSDAGRPPDPVTVRLTREQPSADVTISLTEGFTHCVIVRGREAEPIPGSAITLLSRSSFDAGLRLDTKTDTDGRALLRGVRIGSYRLVVTAQGYDPVDLESVDVDGNPASCTTVVMVPGGSHRIAGVVVDRQERPLSGIQVRVIPGRAAFGDRSAVTDARGRFEITGLDVPPPPRSLRAVRSRSSLTVQLTGADIATVTYPVQVDQDVRLVAAAPASVRGVVVSSDGSEKFSLRLSLDESTAFDSSIDVDWRIRADGHFEAKQIPALDATLWVHPERSPVVRVPIRPSANSDLDVGEIRLLSGGTCSGSLVLSGGDESLVGQATVVLMDASGNVPASGWAGVSRGRFRFPGQVPVGDWTAHAVGQDLISSPVDVRVRRSEETVVNIPAWRTSRLTIVCVDKARRPIADLRCELAYSGPHQAAYRNRLITLRSGVGVVQGSDPSTTDVGGRIVFDRLPPGDYRVVPDSPRVEGLSIQIDEGQRRSAELLASD